MNNLKRITDQLYLNTNIIVALEEHWSIKNELYVTVYLENGESFEIFGTLDKVYKKLFGERK
jgi:hypothetical protein